MVVPCFYAYFRTSGSFWLIFTCAISLKHTYIINPWRTRTARVMVVGLSVCLSVCLLSHISCREHLFVLKLMSCIQRAMKVFVGFFLKLLRCRDHPTFSSLYGHMYRRPLFTHICYVHTTHTGAFIWRSVAGGGCA